MKKVFEDYFTELQSEMIAACLEYIENRAEKVFVYGSFEECCISSGFFYQINGKILKKHKVNDGLIEGEETFDVSPDHQLVALTVMNNNIEELIELCSEYKRDMPTEIKLVYDVANNSVSAEYKYEPVFSESATKMSDHIVDEWMDMERNKIK